VLLAAVRYLHISKRSRSVLLRGGLALARETVEYQRFREAFYASCLQPLIARLARDIPGHAGTCWRSREATSAAP